MPAHIRAVDLNYNQGESDKIIVHLVQMGSIFNFNDFYKKEFQDAQSSEIINNINNIDLNNDGKDVIIFPELTVPNSLIPYLKNFARITNSIIISGMFYDEKYHNSCCIFDSKGTVHRQYKLDPAPDEDPKVHEAHNNLERVINIFVNTPIGDFSAIICFDLLNYKNLADIGNLIDHLIILTMNKSVEKFIVSAAGFSETAYCHAIICNVQKYGGSGIYGPFHKNTCLATLPSARSQEARSEESGEFPIDSMIISYVFSSRR
jgi:hypothetical protein